MSNRGRHRKEILTHRTVPGWSMLQFTFTPKGKRYLYSLDIDGHKLYTIYLNEKHQICRIEEGIKTTNTHWLNF